MAFTFSRALLNQLPSMVDRGGLLLGSGVRAMRCDKCGLVVRLFNTAYGELCGNCINKIEREVNY